MTTPQDHRALRELLGAFSLGSLPEELTPALVAHLDGCAACRAELAEIAPLADRLREVDPALLSESAQPPGDLGERIQARVAAEAELARGRQRRAARRAAVHRSTRRLLAGAAATGLLAAGLAGGTLLSRGDTPRVVARPTPSATSVVPLERVALAATSGVRADGADVIAHTWGVEARFTASGFAAGRVYRAAFRTGDGRLLPAGEFLGTGDKKLVCNMQSALLRDDAVGFVVMDDAGAAVLTARL